MYFHIQNTRKGLKNVSQPLVASDKFTAQKKILCIKTHILKKSTHCPKTMCAFYVIFFIPKIVQSFYRVIFDKIFVNCLTKQRHGIGNRRTLQLCTRRVKMSAASNLFQNQLYIDLAL